MPARLAVYECLRQAIAERRIVFPHDEETIRDLLALQVDHQKQRVDHLSHTAKDSCDALAAVCYHLSFNVKPFLLAGLVEGAGMAGIAPQLGGQVSVAYAGFDSVMELIRHQRGIGSIH